MLKPLQAIMPMGQFDGHDTEVASFVGGEVCSLMYVANTVATDKAAYDAFDGYVLASTTQVRPVVTKTFSSAVSLSPSGPMFLADDGIWGYGTLLGSVVGQTVGQTTYGYGQVPSTLLGPSTATGSGKITCWGMPGLYLISLDAVDSTNATASTGLSPINAALTGGDALTFTTSGQLTPVGKKVAGSTYAYGSPQVGHLVDFNTNGSLVNTPNYLVAALNSPSGNMSSVTARSLLYATVWFNPTQ
jgi:hypothetical protein